MKTWKKFIETDYLGMRFNRLIFLCDLGMKMGSRYALVQCDCGVKKNVALNNLKCGRTQSCGCARRNNIPEKIRNTYNQMIQRCYNPKSSHYDDYGGRGISVCCSWRKSMGLFYQNMGDRPTPKHSIDRIDNDGNYEPLNCKWSTWKQQAQNKRTTDLLTPANVAKKTSFSKQYICQLSESGRLDRFIESKKIIIKKNRVVFHIGVVNFFKQ